MRVADKMNYEQVQNSLMRNRNEMSKLQNQAATMKRITKPSDDPVGTTQVLAARTDQTINKQYLKNLDVAKSFLENSEQALASVSETLLRVKELALGQVNDASANAITRRTTATEIDQIYKHIINVGNGKIGDRFMFGGFQTQNLPFELRGDYNGDQGEIQIEVSKGVYVPMNLNGKQIFLGKGLSEAPTWGNSKGSDQQAPGDPAEMEGAEVRGPASATTSDGSKNTIDVRNSNLERAPHVDQVGDQRLGEQDGVNIFHALQQVEIGLRTNDKKTIQDSLQSIDMAIEQIVVARARLGSRLMNLDAIRDSIQKSNIEAKTIQSSVEDADVYELMTDLSRTENTLKSSLSTSGKLIQPSLLDFLK